MIYDGSAFYDNEDVFRTYMARRQRAENPNDTLEKPVLFELLGDVTDKKILDLGCGDAALGSEAFAKGCQAYVGIEGSSNMVKAAQQTLAGTNGTVIHSAVERWDFPGEAFDLVVSRLVLHYIEDTEAIFRRVHQTLTEHGRFVFSIEHPVITSCDRAYQGSDKRQDWVVDNYFETGQRITSWMGGQVVKYHRTVEDYFTSLQGAGFQIESLREAAPRPEHFENNSETYQRRRRIPLFLIMASQKH